MKLLILFVCLLLKFKLWENTYMYCNLLSTSCLDKALTFLFAFQTDVSPTLDNNLFSFLNGEQRQAVPNGCNSYFDSHLFIPGIKR